MIPGDTIGEIEAAYKQRRAAAVSKGRTTLVKALDRTLPLRLQHLKASASQLSPPESPSSQVSTKVSQKKLLPGDTVEEIEAAYKQRRAAAVSKGRTTLVKALDRTLPLRLKHLKASASHKIRQQSPSPQAPIKVSQKKLLPGDTPVEVEAVYKQRRAAAVSKGRTTLVKAFDRTLPMRLQQTKQIQIPAKIAPSSPSQLYVGRDWKEVFGPVDITNPNPRTVSEKYQALRKQAADDDVSKLNALFQQAIGDIKLIKRHRAQIRQQNKAKSIKASQQAKSIKAIEQAKSAKAIELRRASANQQAKSAKTIELRRASANQQAKSIKARSVPQQPRARSVPQQPRAMSVPQQPRAMSVPQQPRARSAPLQLKAMSVPQQPRARSVPQQPRARSVPQQPRARSAPLQLKAR